MSSVLAISYGLDTSVWNSLHDHLQRRGVRLILLTVTKHQARRDLRCEWVDIPFGLSGLSGTYRSAAVPPIEREQLRIWQAREGAYFRDPARTVTDEKIFEFYQLVDRVIREKNCSVGLTWNRIFPMSDVLRRCCVDWGCATLDLERGLIVDTLMIDRYGIGALSELFSSPVLRAQSTSAPTMRERLRLRRFKRGYLRLCPTKYRQHTPVSGAELRHKYRISPGVPLIFFAGQADADLGLFPPDTPLARLQSPLFTHTYDALSFVVSEVDRLGNAKIIFKPHPTDQLFRHQRLPENVITARGENLHSLIAASDMMITLSSPVMIDGLLHDTPVVTLARHQLSGRGIVYEPHSRHEILPLIRAALVRDGFPHRLELFERFMCWLLDHYLFRTRSHGPVRHSLADLADVLAGYQQRYGAGTAVFPHDAVT